MPICIECAVKPGAMKPFLKWDCAAARAEFEKSRGAGETGEA